MSVVRKYGALFVLLFALAGMFSFSSCRTKHKCHDCPTFGHTSPASAAKSS